MSYAMSAPVAFRASESARAAFIRRTYAHLAGALLAFACIEFLIFGLVPYQQLDAFMLTYYVQSPVSALIVLALFLGFGWLGRMWAYSDTSPGVQYFGLALYILLEAVIFVPLLWWVTHVLHDTSIITTAGIMTLAIFGGLTMTCFATRKDFSFLGPVLCVASWLALGFVVAALLVGFNLGLVFGFAMIALASGFILYDTSNVIHHFRTDQHVAASLELFASVAYLFYYIIWTLAQASRE
jgi:FtsH-binding integral membrane protein